jgi:AraC-like DNA-binding protein
MARAHPRQIHNEKIYLPHKIAAFVNTLAEDGISAEETLGETGLRPDSVDNPATRTSISQLLTVCHNAIRLCPNPSVPFRVGGRMHISSYGMYGYALLCSSTWRDALNFAVKYHVLTKPIFGMQWREEQGTVVSLFLEDSAIDLTNGLYRYLLELHLVARVTVSRDVRGPAGIPVRARISYSAPHHAELYEKYLGCPVLFGQPENALYFDTTGFGLDDPLPLANRLTEALVRATCDRLLAEIGTYSGIARRVYKILMQTPGEFPDTEIVARALNTTSRTLRRRLEIEGTSYHQMLDDVRRYLAIEYLRETRMSTADIAVRLGFSDAANFRHAFRRWTGKSPSDYRR